MTLPEIKLKRTETTLDLSQKAKRSEEEKEKKERGKKFEVVEGREKKKR